MKKPRLTSPFLTLVLLILTGLGMNVCSLMLMGWSGGFRLYLLNALPVVLLLLVLWFATGQAWLSCLVTGALLFLLTGANYFMMEFRSTPFLWSDLSHIQEGFGMAGQYSLQFTREMYLWIAVILACALVLFLLGRRRPGAILRLLGLTASGLALIVTFYDFYPDSQLYASLAGSAAGNQTDAYKACGVVYPFLHSASPSTRSYDLAEAEEILSSYTDADIPPERKVNLIGIQLEAYCDLSEYPVEGMSPEIYTDFHALQAQSYHGRLVTDIFAGGTTETEWAVLTGGNLHDDFSHPTPSAAWYLRTQGYTANGSHPCRQWFYNRAKVNPNLGFEEYLFMDNYYKDLSEEEDVAYDNVYFPDLEQRLSDYFAQPDHKPLFSFNVTYQGHGPYDSQQAYWGRDYCTGPYQETTLNILNNYFYLMQDTGAHLRHLTEYLNTLQEPVVLFLYGDHKPWLGNSASIYKGLGIDLDTSGETGFLNYYSTWYMIWANQSAKAQLGNDFQGQGPDLSPCFLMDEVFRQCGWEGNAYMQAQRETALLLPVLHTSGWVKENGAYTQTPSPAAQASMERFQGLSAFSRKGTP